jgi:alanyl-tRNA synthetase
MTERLYYSDSYLTEFRASVVERVPDGNKLYLDRTAFYPTSGGQLFDTGTIAGVPVLDVVDEGERVAHILSAPVVSCFGAAGEVECRVNWPRRFDHMQQHSGQHLLSAILAELFGIATLSVHFGAESSTIDVQTPSLTALQIRAVERRANEAVWENRPLAVAFAENSEELGLRKASERSGLLRIVSIEGLDRSACGGTHVRATGEIGPVLIRKLDKIRGVARIEFLCGLRALGRARADFDALSGIAQSLSAPLDDAPALVAAQMEALKSADKERRRLENDLGAALGRELYDATPPDAQGVRRAVKRLDSGVLDALRAMSQGFCARPLAVFVGVVEQPPAILMATSQDSGLDAGKLVKAALSEVGGKGGGAPRIAQGSVPSKEALERALTALSTSRPD